MKNQLEVDNLYQDLYLGRQNQEEADSSQIFNDVKQLVFHLQQEKLTPELLPFQETLFEKIRKEIKEQEERVSLFKKPQREGEDQEMTPSVKNYKTVIYNLQIERFSFILKHYSKIRLEKIQTYCFYYTQNKAHAQKIMSPSQLEFLKKYTDLRYKYYEKNVFKFFPKNFRGIGGMELFMGKPEETRYVNSNQSDSKVLEPNFGEYVFLKLNSNPNEFRYKEDMEIDGIPVEESQIASRSDILFIPYRLAKSLMDRSRPGEMFIL